MRTRKSSDSLAPLKAGGRFWGGKGDGKEFYENSRRILENGHKPASRVRAALTKRAKSMKVSLMETDE